MLGIVALLKPAISEPPPPAAAGWRRGESVLCTLSDTGNTRVGFALSPVAGSGLSFRRSCLRAMLGARSHQGRSFPVPYFHSVLTHGLALLWETIF